jgi:hypothetical protein
MRRFEKSVCLAAVAASLLLVAENQVSAQYPVYYAPPPVVPAVVGYSARRAGLFGRRVVVRPVVAAVPVPTVPVAISTVAVARPVVTTSFGTETPVAAFYPPAVSIPVARYRIPYGAYYPVYGY